MAILTARLVQTMAKYTRNPLTGDKGLSAAQLFVDVLAALCSAIRELIMNTKLDRSGIAKMNLKAGLPPSAALALEQTLHQVPSLHRPDLKLDDHYDAVLGEAYRDE